MGKRQYSRYQQELIGRYYENLDTIMLGRLGELVTELYLAQTEAKQQRLWEKAHKAMVQLKIPGAIISHIMAKRNVEVLARNLSGWLKEANKK